MCCVCVTSRTALIFVGNSYENSKEINVTISVDDKVLYNGFLKAYEIPMLLEKKKRFLRNVIISKCSIDSFIFFRKLFGLILILQLMTYY